METKKIIAEGVGLVFILVAIRTFDKKLAAAISMKSALVIIGSLTLVTFATNVAEERGYFR